MSLAARLLSLTLLALAVAALLSACREGDGSHGPTSGAQLRVVATTTQAADLARNVGGRRTEVVTLLPSGADPHAHEVRPRDVDAIAAADVVVRSGGDLDEWLKEAIDAAGGEPATVNLIRHVPTVEGGRAGEEHGNAGGTAAEDDGHEAEVDPHWWQDPRNAERAVAALADAFARSDQAGAATYARNARAYAKRVRALDARVADCMRAIPARQRKLVTTHDSLGYFADRYDLDLVGTVIPSLSTRGQPSAGETAELVKTIRREHARAVFTEVAVNAKLERAIAADAGASLGEPLLTDSLAPAGRPGDTYLGATALNAERLAAGFTGERDRCDLGARGRGA